MIKFTECRGRPSLMIPCKHFDYCDANKYPVIVVWKRAVKADITWLNEPFQRSHRDLFSDDVFRLDIENRAEQIYLKYATSKTARAITHSFMTLYDLSIADARCAATELFDMTMSILKEYEAKP